MSQQQWRRFLPEGKHLFLAAVLAVLVLAGVGFASLFQIKAEATAERAAAAAQVQQLEQQKEQLKGTLARAQDGGSLETDARRYFNLGRPGEKAIVAEAATPAGAQSPATAAPGTGPGRTAPPYWQRWLDRLLGR